MMQFLFKSDASSLTCCRWCQRRLQVFPCCVMADPSPTPPDPSLPLPLSLPPSFLFSFLSSPLLSSFLFPLSSLLSPLSSLFSPLSSSLFVSSLSASFPRVFPQKGQTHESRAGHARPRVWDAPHIPHTSVCRKYVLPTCITIVPTKSQRRHGAVEGRRDRDACAQRSRRTAQGDEILRPPRGHFPPNIFLMFLIRQQTTRVQRL